MTATGLSLCALLGNAPQRGCMCRLSAACGGLTQGWESPGEAGKEHPGKRAANGTEKGKAEELRERKAVMMKQKMQNYCTREITIPINSKVLSINYNVNCS